MVISRAMLLAIGYQRYHLDVVVVGYFLVFESMCSALVAVVASINKLLAGGSGSPRQRSSPTVSQLGEL